MSQGWAPAFFVRPYYKSFGRLCLEDLPREDGRHGEGPAQRQLAMTDKGRKVVSSFEVLEMARTLAEKAKQHKLADEIAALLRPAARCPWWVV